MTECGDVYAERLAREESGDTALRGDLVSVMIRKADWLEVERVAHESQVPVCDVLDDVIRIGLGQVNGA